LTQSLEVHLGPDSKQCSGGISFGSQSVCRISTRWEA